MLISFNQWFENYLSRDSATSHLPLLYLRRRGKFSFRPCSLRSKRKLQLRKSGASFPVASSGSSTFPHPTLFAAPQPGKHLPAALAYSPHHVLPFLSGLLPSFSLRQSFRPWLDLAQDWMRRNFQRLLCHTPHSHSSVSHTLGCSAEGPTSATAACQMHMWAGPCFPHRLFQSLYLLGASSIPLCR